MTFIPAPTSPTQPDGPDLRLAGPALGAWLSALWALYLSPGQATGLAVTAGLLAGICWYARRRQPGALPLTVVTAVIGVLLGVVSGSVATAARTSARDAEPLAQLAVERATVRAELVTTDDPRRGRGARVRTWLVPARMTWFRTASGRGPAVRLDVRVLVISDHAGWRGVLPGQRASVTGRLGPPRGGDLRAATLSVSLAPRWLGKPPAA
ncbi:MAG: ComEC/Rec2 family competence protein, partial [Micromonosporaceae bacterium]